MMAVERVRDGERASSVVASFGFHRTTIAAIEVDPAEWTTGAGT
jgi:hypothetical protein